MDNLQSIRGDAGFLHKQFCSGARGKRQQASFTNICRNQLAAETAVFFVFGFFFSSQGNSPEGNEKVEKYRT